MSNKPLNKFLTFLVMGSSLLACQTAPQTATTPEPTVEATVEPVITQQPADPQQTLYQQAIKSTQDGEIDKAIEQFIQIVKDNPSTKQAYTHLGLLYLHQEKNELAKIAFENAINQDKNDAIAYNHLAVIQRQQGKFKLALFNYYKAIGAKPDYANAHLNLGILLDIYLQDLPKALEQYEIFQKLTDNKNEQVGKWVIDTRRRIDSNKDKSK